jgi:ParB family transcriptional regulator, chromosome partitioning protein
VRQVALSSISASQRNPRRKLRAIDELAASLQTHGLLQPVVVRRLGEGRYELVAGHRRLEAARQLGWKTIPAVVRSESEDEAYVLTLVENLQRQDLSPREEATALEVLVRQRGWSTHQVAATVQRSQAYVSKRLRVFEDAMLAPAVLADKISISAAEELLAVPERHRYDILSRAVEAGWELAQMRAEVSRYRFGPNRSAAPGRASLRQRIRALRMELRDVRPEDLGEPDRRELRLMFKELGMLARAKPQVQHVLPPLKQVR